MDYYSLLGVGRDASEKEIKSAYKKAARKYHPDNSETGDEEKFKKLAEAYEVLRDPQKKSIYDQYGEEGLKGAGGFGGFGDFSGAAGFEDLGDIFSSFFGGGFGSRRGGGGAERRRGQDHSVEIDLDFYDPLEERKKRIRFNPLVECQTCNGKGAEKDSDIVSCTTCGGLGQVTSVQNTLLGQIRQTTTCPSCRGSGKEIKKPCTKCKGKGQKRESKEVEVNIPAGIFDGATMRLAGVGDTGVNGGAQGDIYLHINVAEDFKFKRQEADVFSELEIGFAEAALGTKVEVPTIRGSKQVKIEAGTQNDLIIHLKSEGFPRLNNSSRNGDQHIRVLVKTPKSLSRDEKKLLEEFQKLRQGKDVAV